MKEGVDVSNLFKFGAIGSNKVFDDRIHVRTMTYVLEELKAGAVQEIVTRHGVIDDVQYHREVISLNEVVNEILVVKSHARAKELESD